MEQQCEELRYKKVGTLLASDAEAYSYFGTSAAVDGVRLVVGAYGTNTTAVATGKVYVYDWNGTAYVEVAQLLASDGQASDYFGISVALSGNRLVVGAHFEDTAGLAAGKVYVYNWNSDTSVYDEVTTITASDAQAYDWFGSAVALPSIGNRLLVGACGEDTAGVNAGKVYIYEWNGATSVYDEVAQLTASDAQDYDYFGISVAISGNRLVVGAHFEDTAGLVTGKVRVYDWNPTTSAYVEVSQLTASDSQAYDLFGDAVALSGNRLVVGARGADTAVVNAGKVYIYNWNGSAYVEVAQLTASGVTANDYFGISVAISSIGNRLVVGACSEDTAGSEAGAVYLYDWTGSVPSLVDNG